MKDLSYNELDPIGQQKIPFIDENAKPHEIKGEEPLESGYGWRDLVTVEC